MNRNLLEEFHNDPALLRRSLSTAAHRERARAIGDATASLLRWIVHLYHALTARISPRPARWLARLG